MAMTKTKQLVLLALLMAIQVIISFFYIPVFDNLRIYFTYFVMILVAIIFNSGVAIFYAIIEDLIAFFIYPTGPFFIGYTLSAALSMLIYSLFLNKRVSITRILLAKLSVNIIVNVLLGSLWSMILYSKAYLFYLGASIVKNTALLPLEVIAFLIFYRLIQKNLLARGLINQNKLLVINQKRHNHNRYKWGRRYNQIDPLSQRSSLVLVSSHNQDPKPRKR